MKRPTLIFVAGAALALAVGGEGLATEPWDPTALGFRGKVVFKNFSHFEETPTDNDNLRNEAMLQVEWARRFTPSVDVKLVGDRVGSAPRTRQLRWTAFSRIL